MKKQIIISMLVLLLVGTIIGQLALSRDIDITLDKNTKTKLAEYDIIEPKTSELICDSTTCEFTMYETYQINRVVYDDEDGRLLENVTIDERYGLDTHTFERGDMTQQQLLDKQQEVIDEFLKGYANTLKEREDKEIKTKVGDEGRIILK